MLFSHGRSQPLTKYFAILEPRLTSFALSANVNIWILRLWKWLYFRSCHRCSLYPAASIIPRAGRPASVSEVAPATHVSNSDRAGAWPTFAKNWSILAPQHPPRFHFKNLMNPVHCMNGSCNIFRLHKKCWLSNTEISQKKWGWHLYKKDSRKPDRAFYYSRKKSLEIDRFGKFRNVEGRIWILDNCDICFAGKP